MDNKIVKSLKELISDEEYYGMLDWLDIQKQRGNYITYNLFGKESLRKLTFEEYKQLLKLKKN